MFRLSSISDRFLVAALIAAGAICRGGVVVTPVAGSTSGVGENIFRAKCAVCHGVDGSGRTPNGKKLKVPDLRSDRVQNHDDDELLDVVSNGKGDMPPFRKKYSADKIQQVVAYVRSLGQRN